MKTFSCGKTRYVLRFLGPCLCAIFRHNDTLQISSIGEISARSQGQAVTPSALFQARDISADETRSLRRIAFILFHSRIGEFGASIRTLLRRIEADWRKNDAAISAACFLLLRVIILRVPPEHIIGSRALILSETMRILRLAAGEPYAALAAIKFVDQLLLLNLPEFSGMPIKVNPHRFLSSTQRRASADANEVRLSAKSASSTVALRALRSYARALCLRCSDAAVAYSPPCIMAIEQWVESEFLSAAELWKELSPR
ncbi:hypothetical protein F1559_002507 [Cyanidiococcus yangmingshanensis]|uniref:DOP1-like C-terminal domain-containing protein n=1 Tax=Cyanidiococcus yangmingshanensis TaxID=2690220 RepID=A0A7J7IF58_9RHOD|nr:hypothetical protein F1559_002507 [Cyanidiococcus yangmingshanensis]